MLSWKVDTLDNGTRNRAYYGLHCLLRSSTKSEIYRTFICRVVLYGHQSWTIRTEDANTLSVFERRSIRAIFGGVFEHVQRTEHPDGDKGWQDTMAGTCYEDAGLMPHQDGV